MRVCFKLCAHCHHIFAGCTGAGTGTRTGLASYFCTGECMIMYASRGHTIVDPPKEPPPRGKKMEPIEEETEEEIEAEIPN